MRDRQGGKLTALGFTAGIRHQIETILRCPPAFAAAWGIAPAQVRASSQFSQRSPSCGIVYRMRIAKRVDVVVFLYELFMNVSWVRTKRFSKHNGIIRSSLVSGGGVVGRRRVDVCSAEGVQAAAASLQ